MATRGKESGGKVKEKRGISQAKPFQTHGVGSPSPSDTKRIPNYLKPTISSSPDTPTKPISSGKIKTSVDSITTHNRPILSRRRSFDKPPSPSSQLHKAPHTTTTNTKERKILVSSSSFKSAAKTPHTPRPHLEKLSKASKAPPNLVTFPIKTVKKSSCTTNTTIKKENVKTSNNAICFADPTAKDDTQKIGKEDSPNPEPQKEGHESTRTEAAEGEDMSNVDNINELPTEIVTVEHNIHTDLVQENDQTDDAIKLHEPPPVEQNDVAAVAAEINERDDNINICEDTDKNSRFRDDHKIHPDESFAGETKLVDGTEKNEQVEEDEEVATENTENKQLDEKYEVKVELEAAAEEVNDKPEMEKIQAGKGQAGQAMKKESAAYNDVIEETASKLREQRKNKVKALVGAFETVISLQEPEANSPN